MYIQKELPVQIWQFICTSCIVVVTVNMVIFTVCTVKCIYLKRNSVLLIEACRFNVNGTKMCFSLHETPVVLSRTGGICQQYILMLYIRQCRNRFEWLLNILSFQIFYLSSDCLCLCLSVKMEQCCTISEWYWYSWSSVGSPICCCWSWCMLCIGDTI